MFKKHPWVLPLLLSLLILFPALTTFFNSDDFYHLKISQANNLQEVLSFFSFYKPKGEFLYYRPLTTQLPLYLLSKLFFLNPAPYHFLSFLLFIIIVFLVYQLAKEIGGNKKLALWTTFFYGFSSSNLTRLAWIAQIQELGLGASFLASCWLFLKNKRFLSWLLFLVALGSKESAVILPIILSGLWFFKKRQSKKLTNRQDGIFLLTTYFSLFLYLYLRIFKMGFSIEGHYFTDFSLKKILNTSFWYGLWSLSLPELLVDYVGSGLRINPKIFIFYGQFIRPIFLFFIVFVLISLVTFIFKWKKLNKKIGLKLIFFSIFWFMINLLPHLFSPFHKFSYELTVPLFGLAIFLGWLFEGNKKSYLAKLGLVFFFLLSTLTNYLTFRTHWVFKRGEIARRVLDYAATHHSKSPEPFFFYNDQLAENAIWGVSRQIDHSLFGSSALQVFYQDFRRRTYFEDDLLPPSGQEVVKLPSSDFLN